MEGLGGCTEGKSLQGSWAMEQPCGEAWGGVADASQEGLCSLFKNIITFCGITVALGYAHCQQASSVPSIRGGHRKPEKALL